MNNFTKTVLSFALFAAGFSARADLFYWLVDETGLPAASQVSFSYAKIAVSGSGVAAGTYLSQVGSSGENLGTEVANVDDPAEGLKTLAYYADLGTYASSAYNFAVELYGLDDSLVGVSDYINYATLREKFIYSNMGQVGIDPYTYNSFSAAPEPTGALLLLVGWGLLSLRRRRAVCALAAAAIGLGAMAAENDEILAFGTRGIDTYADGTRVLNGESYAIIWTQTGATFGGLGADGRPVAETDRLVLVAPLAKEGRCPTTILEIAAADAARYEGGSFALYLLDTRVRSANGRLSLAPYANGAPQLVNALGLAAEGASSAAGSLAGASAVRLASVGRYTEVDAPDITSLRVGADTVTITVERLSPTLDYFVVPGAQPGHFSAALDVKPAADGTFTFPKPKDATFFKVIGARKF